MNELEEEVKKEREVKEKTLTPIPQIAIDRVYPKSLSDLENFLMMGEQRPLDYPDAFWAFLFQDLVIKSCTGVQLNYERYKMGIDSTARKEYLGIMSPPEKEKAPPMAIPMLPTAPPPPPEKPAKRRGFIRRK
jgi:hypothetical protein